MVTRDEAVRVSLQDDFSTGMAKIAAVTALANRELEQLDGSSTKAEGSTRRVGAAVMATAPAVQRMSGEVGKLSTQLDKQKQSLSEAEAALAHMRSELQGADGDTTELESAIAKQAKAVDRYRSTVSQTEATLRAYSAVQRETSEVVGEVDQKTEKLDQDTQKLGRSTGNSANEIDKYSGRLRVLGETAAIASPAIVAFGAVSTAATVGLSAGLGLVIGTAGTALVAFQGVGDAVKALTKYNTEPTAANLQAAQQAMAQLGPDAAKFVVEFGKVTPVLKQVRDAAAAGWFPGLTKALDDLITQAPKVERLFTSIGTAAGNSTADFAAQVKGGAYDEFLRFVQTEAPQAITSLGSTLGSLTHGLATLLAQTGNVDNGFLAWINSAAQGFDRWAQSAEGRRDVQEFLDYVRQSGPEVAHLIGQVTIAIAEIVKAAAPLSGVTLKAFTDLAEVIAKIAGSDLGPPIVAGVIALSALNRALAVTKALTTATAFAGTSKLGLGLLGGLSSLNAVKADYAALTTAEARAYNGQSRLGAAGAAVSNNLSGLAKTAGYAGVAVAGLAASQGLLGKSLQNNSTLTYAAAGAIAGPYGIAVGAAIGLVTDWAKVNNDLNSSIKASQDSLSSLDFSSFSSQLADVRKQTEGLASSASSGHSTLSLFKDGLLSQVPGLSGRGLAESQKQSDAAAQGAAAIHDLQMAQLNAEQAAAGLGRAMGQTIGPLDGSARSAAQLTNALQVANPAMVKLGITSQGLVNSHALKGINEQGSLVGTVFRQAGIDTSSFVGIYASNIAKIAATTARMNSQAGRADAVAAAIKSIGTNSQNSANAATQLQTALEALTSPGENLVAATDAYTTSIRTLGADLNKQSKDLNSNTNAAIQNRAAIQDRVDKLKGQIVAEAGSGASSDKLSRSLQEQRKRLLDAADAAGVNRKQMVDLLNKYGLTPKLIQTAIVNTALQAAKQADGYASALHQIPSNVSTTLRVQNQALKAIAAIKAQLASVPRSIYSTVYVNQVNAANKRIGSTGDVPGHADGGLIRGPGGPREDRIPAWLSNGEFVVNAAATRANLGLLHAINAQRFADGGHVGKHHKKHDKDKPLFTGEGPAWYARAYKHGRPFAIDGPDKWDYPYQSGTGSQKNERAFEKWVNDNKVPFDAGAKLVDYDMRGYWNKTHGKGWHEGSHFPDTWKTPYDTTFSSESMYATKNNPFNWHGDSLYDDRSGQLIFAAMGGLISGPGGPRDDRIPAWLSNGEFVMNAAATAQFLPLLHQMNARQFATGGQVTPTGTSSALASPTAQANRLFGSTYSKSRRDPFGVAYDFTALENGSRYAAASLLTLGASAKQELTARQRLLTLAQQRDQQETSALRDRLQAVRQDEADLRSAITTTLTKNLFDTSSSSSSSSYTAPVTPSLFTSLPDGVGANLSGTAQAALLNQLNAPILADIAKANAAQNAADRKQAAADRKAAQGPSLGDLTKGLTQQGADANLFNLAEQQLKRKGVKGAALQYLLSNATPDELSQYADGSRAQLSRFTKAYNSSQSAVGRAAQQGARGVFGAREAAAERVLKAQLAENKATTQAAREANRQLREYERRQEQRHKDQQKRLEAIKKAAAVDGPTRVGNEINQKIVKGYRGG